MVLFTLAIIGYFVNNTHKNQQVKTTVHVFETITPKNSTNTFKCDGREYCSQMHSRAEAEYFIRNCPNTKMDGDHDGIPCENDSRFN